MDWWNYEITFRVKVQKLDGTPFDAELLILKGNVLSVKTLRIKRIEGDILF